MNSKLILFDQKAREKLIEGIHIVSEAVGSTLSPKGRNVAIDRSWNIPQVVHDGVTVAKNIILKDPFENMGAQLVKEAAGKTNDLAGDGTTQATILTRAIVDKAFEKIKDKANPMMVRKGIEIATEYLTTEIQKKAKKVETDEEAKQIATISAQDEKIGQIISEALKKVGKDGVITVEEGRGLDIELELREGMEFDRGYINPYMVTDPNKMIAEIENPAILITNHKFQEDTEMVNLLGWFVNNNIKNFVIIADVIEDKALAAIIVNKLQGTIKAIGIQAPGFGDKRNELLQDIAVVTGGTVINEETGISLENMTVDVLGHADRIIAKANLTDIIGGQGTKKDISARVKQIENQIKESEVDFDKDKLKERKAKLVSGVAVVKVGAMSQPEMEERRERIIDAVGATQAAIEEGIIPGGQIALIKIAGGLDKLTKEQTNKDIASGIQVVKSAIEAPFIQLMMNTGFEEYETYNMVDKVKQTPFNEGYDVVQEKWGDMTEFGVIDPVKVVRIALQNAASVAVMVMTTHVLITDDPNDKPIQQK